MGASAIFKLTFAPALLSPPMVGCGLPTRLIRGQRERGATGNAEAVQDAVQAVVSAQRVMRTQIRLLAEMLVRGGLTPAER